jgi:hypothetical protein
MKKIITILTAISAISSLVFSEESEIAGRRNPAEYQNAETGISGKTPENGAGEYNRIFKTTPVADTPFKEERPCNLGFIFTLSGPRFLYRHYFQNRMGLQVNFTFSSTELQSSYRGGAALLMTIAKTPQEARKQRRLYMAVNMDFDHHAQYMKEYFDGDVRDRTDARLITEFTPAIGISIGKYVPLTLEGGFALSKYTTFEGKGMERYRNGMRYAISLAYSLSLAKTFNGVFRQ